MTRSVTSDEADNINESEKLLFADQKSNGGAVLTQLAQGYTAKQCAEILFLKHEQFRYEIHMLDILELDKPH
ncbi:hypothetical protein O9993_03795 [Vibrio lentus]|nr:hypothetical protein [Vibrio lentus]